ncbi:hypothetical protein DCAR_0933792 [Daucus carota subsp. sativus]|uniref:Retrovirus-related Pol polyprotein from transposon TNT 1-94-like beta-barrel domain-containing protein n=1 Tax=Daucus carota subsp. sativus TaxID=79200 RepID=A0AAF1BDS1_DAUCS|nr:hypothetical protein DCAR_0933792 [Daucus carota subsp. sativus]
MQMFCPNFKEDLRSFKEMKGKNKVEDAHSTHVVEDGEFLMASDDIVSDSVKNKSEWVMDSAASMHICRDRAMFETLCTDEDLGYIIVGNDEKMKVQGVGTVCLKLHDGTIKKALNAVLTVSQSLRTRLVAVPEEQVQLHSSRLNLNVLITLVT